MSNVFSRPELDLDDADNRAVAGAPTAGLSSGQVTEQDRDAAAAPVGTPISKWAIHRHLYDWVLGFSHKPYATGALGALSFAESSFFPIPPDVLLMPMCLGHRRRAWWFATVCTVASVLGGILGYFIGYAFWEATQQIWFDYVPGFNAEKFATVERLYNEKGIWILFAAAFTPIPFKVFTICGGVFQQSLPLFIVVSLIGRGMRFFLVGGLMWAFGQRILPFIDRWFNLLSILFVVLMIAGFAVLKLLH